MEVEWRWSGGGVGVEWRWSGGGVEVECRRGGGGVQFLASAAVTKTTPTCRTSTTSLDGSHQVGTLERNDDRDQRPASRIVGRHRAAAAAGDGAAPHAYLIGVPRASEQECY